MKDPARRAGNNLVPLVIGVTGHRDLPVEEAPLIKQRVRTFLEDLRRDYPELPMLVMTPLAEGADRIAAVAAHELGIPITVLLPMPRALYESDFHGDSLAEFNEMLTLGELVELPLLDGTDANDVARPGRLRDLQYAQLGAYLAAHSHILLAVWDGLARAGVIELLAGPATHPYLPLEPDPALIDAQLDLLLHGLQRKAPRRPRPATP